MKRCILIITVFVMIYSVFPELKATVQNITFTMIASVASIVVAVFLYNVFKFLIKLSKNDKCKVYQEKDGKITRLD